METLASFRNFSSSGRIHAGADAVRQVRNEVERVGARRAFVVCGKSVARSELFGRVRDNLDDRFAGVFAGVEASTPLPSVMAGAAAAREAGADLLVCVGGGSAMVTTRAILIVLAERQDIHEICTQYPDGGLPVSPRLLAPKLPNIQVLTTPSTAMARAGSAVMDAVTQRRLELYDPKTRPIAMIWDDDALSSTPNHLYLSSAVSALGAILTGLASPQLNPLSEGDLRSALRLSLECLPLLQAGMDDSATRMNLVASSFLSTRALDGMPVRHYGVVSALSHVIDTLYPDLPHGHAGSLTAAAGLRFNRDHTAPGLARLGRLLAPGVECSDEEAARRAPDLVEGIYRSLGMPVRLGEAGIGRQDLDKIAVDAMTDFYLSQNARRVEDASEIVELLEQML